MSKIKIKKEEWYTLAQLVAGNVFPMFGKDPRLYRKIVTNDQASGNILKAVVIGHGPATRYRFKGENIIKFISKVESGK